MNWATILDRTARNVIRPSLTNAVRVLQHDPAYGPSYLWYDEFLDRVLFANSPLRSWRDEDDTRLTVYMQDTAGMPTISDHLVAKAVRLVAKDRTRHVVRDWLTSLTWDGIARIAHAFEDYWQADLARQPADYVRAASANFFIGMVARIFVPGAKLDTMPVFEGSQGLKKSFALDVLGGDWYAVANADVSSKDFLQHLRGKWVMEIAEMQSFSRADITHVKAIMSTRSDSYRPSYGRTVVDYPRQCVFAGTTNVDDWGTDETGLRRFWPIICGDIQLDLLRAARTQLFAEAVHVYRQRATWWDMPGITTAAVQSDRQAQHPWTDAVLRWIELQPDITVADVLTLAVKKDLDTLTMSDAHAVGRILTLAGWKKGNGRRNGKQQKVWKRIGDDDVIL